jgi:hypothetical protein
LLPFCILIQLADEVLTIMHNTTSKAMVWAAVLIIASATYVVFGPIAGIVIGGACIWWAMDQ